MQATLYQRPTTLLSKKKKFPMQKLSLYKIHYIELSSLQTGEQRNLLFLHVSVEITQTN